MDDPAPYLFVYGTLMRQFNNPFAVALRAGAKYVGKGSFPGCLYRVSWYPGAIYDPASAANVYGEIYEMATPQVLLAELDAYEGVSDDEKASMYLRRVVPVISEGQEPLSCWAYVYNQSLQGLAQFDEGRFVP